MPNDLSLGQLFDLADEIGDKYLDSEEIEERTAKLQAVYEDAQDSGLLDD